MDDPADGRRQRGNSTRRALVHAAVDVVTTSGFAGLTLREVASRAGVSAAATTYHFGTVETLVAAVLHEINERAARRLAELGRRSRDGELSLLDACTAYLVDMVGPARRTTQAHLEIRLRAARAPEGSRPLDGPEDRIVDLIAAYTGDRDQADELFTSVFGFGVRGALAPTPPDVDAVRAYLAGLLTRHGLLDRTPTPTTGGTP